MHIVESITEDEMIAIFLKAEINSPRFGASILSYLEQHKRPRSIIDSPDLHLDADNHLRRALLDDYRGYLQKTDLFENFPDSLTWMRVALNRDDLNRIKYINYSYWDKLSSGTRRPIDSVSNIEKGVKVFNVSSQPFLDAVHTLNREKHFPEMILVASSLSDEFILLEGHFRITVYFLAQALIPEEMTAIIGISPQIRQWNFY